MSNDSHHCYEEEHLPQESFEGRPSNRCKQLTDFLRPTFNNTGNILKGKNDKSSGGASNGRECSKELPQNSNSNTSDKTPATLQHKCKEKRKYATRKKRTKLSLRKQPHRNEKPVPSSDTLKSDVVEISYADFLNQPISNSDTQGIKGTPDSFVSLLENKCNEENDVAQTGGIQDGIKNTSAETLSEIGYSGDNETQDGEAIEAMERITKTTDDTEDGSLAEQHPVMSNKEGDVPIKQQDRKEFEAERPSHSQNAGKIEMKTMDHNLTAELNDELDKQHADVEDTTEAALPLKPPKGCVAITSFFQPSLKKISPPSPKKKDANELLVSAEVHISQSGQPSLSNMFRKECSTKKHTVAVKRKQRASVKSNAVADVNDIDLTITHVDTTFITLGKGNAFKSKRLGLEGRKENEKCRKSADGKPVINGIINGVKRECSSEKKIEVKEEQEVCDYSVEEKGQLLMEDKQGKETPDLSKRESNGSSTSENKDVKIKRTKQSILSFACKNDQSSQETKHGGSESEKHLDVKDSGSYNLDRKKHSHPDEKQQSTTMNEIEDLSPAHTRKVVNDEVIICQTRSRKRLRNVLDDSDDDCYQITPEKTQVIDGTYKATLVNPRKHQKGTPMKMKFTRISDNVGQDEELFTPKSRSKKKFDKACKLLKRAKSSGHLQTVKKEQITLRQKYHSSTKNTQPEGPVRRSSRKSSLNASLAITLFNEKKQKVVEKVSSQSKIKKKSAKKFSEKSVSQKKQVLNKTTSKKNLPAVTVAPIFVKKSTAPKAGSSPFAISSDKATEMSEEEREALHIKQNFLRSGVPQKLKKYWTTESISAMSENAPLPTVSHVQQIPEQIPGLDKDCSVWHLDDHPFCKLLLSIQDKTWCDTLQGKPKELRMGLITTSYLKPTQRIVDKGVRCRFPIKKEKIPYLLAEIVTSNPMFPAYHIYRQLMSKKKTDGQNTQETSNNNRCLKTNARKRKQKETVEVETCSKRKRQKPGKSHAIGGCSEVVETCLHHSDGKNTETNKNNGHLGTADVFSVCGDERKDADLLWTEKYAPCRASEILGNRSAVKKLTSWLTEWKQRTDLEMKKLLKEQLRKVEKRDNVSEHSLEDLDRSWLLNDDSDFDVSKEDDGSSCDKDDVNHLHNTVLITGPHGSGKTSMIYALAEELGYKVFEVNAASRRRGKEILSQLQEATQSHQVSKQGVDNADTKFASGGSKLNHVVSDKKAAKAFTSFFKASDQTEKREDDASKLPTSKHKPKVSKRRQLVKEENNIGKSDCDSSYSRTKKGLNLSSVSLIVFDEVDLVFEEDKGFWVAIETFITTTKRPILLTASDPHFQEKFSRNVENIQLKPPTQEILTSYLQVICLVENMRVTFDQLHPLVAVYKNDLRKLLLSLQAWIESGASNQQYPANVHYNKQFLKPVSLADCVNSTDIDVSKSIKSRKGISNEKSSVRSRSLMLDTNSQHGEDFQPKKTPKKSHQENNSSRTKIITKDAVSEEGTSLLCSQESVVEEEQMVELPFDENTPLMEDMVFYSVTGGSCYIEKWQTNSSGLQVFYDDHHSNKSLYCYYLDQQVDLVYMNLVHLLPLPKVTGLPSPSLPLKHRNTFKMMNDYLAVHDICDSEGSDEDWLTLPKSRLTNEHSEEMVNDVKNAEPEINNPHQKITDSKVKKLVTDSLTELASVFDTFSFVDSHLTLPKMDVEGACLVEHFSSECGCLVAGELDDETVFESTPLSQDITNDVRAWTSLGNVNRSRKKLEYLLNSLDHDLKPQAEPLLSIPTMDTRDMLYVTDIQSFPIRERKPVSTAKVISLLACSGSKSAMATDYLPAIRSICRTEQFRMEAGNKRRFFHYMDELTSQLKDSVLYDLCSALQ